MSYKLREDEAWIVWSSVKSNSTAHFMITHLVGQYLDQVRQRVELARDRIKQQQLTLKIAVNALQNHLVNFKTKIDAGVTRFVVRIPLRVQGFYPPLSSVRTSLM